MKTLLKITLVFFVLSFFQSCSKDDSPAPEPIAQPEPEIENQTPTINSQTFEAAENIADNMPIGEVVASDADGDALVYSISANDGNLFEISEAGVLSLDALQILDFETAQSHTITVSVTDGSKSTQAVITINVTDIDETTFVTTWKTTIANETVTIPTRADEYDYNYTIDWGDGTIQSGRTEDAVHVYETAGTYTLAIGGNFPAITTVGNGDSQTQLRTIEQWGNIQWLSMNQAFRNLDNTLRIIATDVPDLSQVTDMEGMFAITHIIGDINTWDVSTITNMSSMFTGASFNEDISTWDVSNVTNMTLMLEDSTFNQDISNWDVSNVIDCTFFADDAPLTPANTPNFTNCTP